MRTAGHHGVPKRGSQPGRGCDVRSTAVSLAVLRPQQLCGSPAVELPDFDRKPCCFSAAQLRTCLKMQLFPTWNWWKDTSTWNKRCNCFLNWWSIPFICSFMVIVWCLMIRRSKFTTRPSILYPGLSDSSCKAYHRRMIPQYHLIEKWWALSWQSIRPRFSQKVLGKLNDPLTTAFTFPAFAKYSQAPLQP